MSATLNWLDAEKMLKSYQQNSRALLKDPVAGAPILKGFRVDKAEVDFILNNSDVIGLIIMPAVNLSDIAKPEAEQVFTMILAGTDAQGNIVENAVVDYMSSCPTNCPKNYPKI
jgi:hypothetical protein